MIKTIFTALLIVLISPNSFAAARPNIILVMADDMGWGDPSYNSNTVTFANGTPHPDQGWISTPTMDAMAAEGLRFDRFYSASAVCSPTRASCLTGRSPIRVGVPTANSGRLEFDETPLSTLLSAEGYRCGHFGKWHLGSMTTLRNDSNRGPDASVYSAPWHHNYDVCFATESKVPTYHPYRKTNNALSLPTSFSDNNFYGTHYWRNPSTWNFTSGEGDPVPVNEVNDLGDGDDSKLIMDQVLPFIQNSVAQGKPFFAVVWLHTPHKPTVDPDGVTGTDSTDSLKDSIEDMDTQIGRLRTELDTLGVRGNTMLWLTSDNGPEDGQNSPNETSTVRSIRSGRELERKRSLYEGGVHVPGILEWPDVITGNIISDFPAVTSDYYPTILDYLCLSVPNQKPLDGISLRPVIEGTATVRTKPIGFEFGGDSSWVNQQYKLINVGSGWELYDLINIADGEEAEQTALATASNIGSKPQAVQDIYHTMLAEYTAWNATLSADTPYIHSSQPTATLTTPETDIAEATFEVTATFSKSVTQLHANEFAVTNGLVTNMTGSGSTRTLTVAPLSTGTVTVNLPEGAAIDSDGTTNGSSNTLSMTFTNPGITTVTHSLTPSYDATVDENGNVPADQDNNLTKFLMGNTNDGVVNPFTSDLYIRSSSTVPLRTVRAFTRFDLTSWAGKSISGATVTFNGHSLNNHEPVNIQLAALGADWAATGLPVPTFGHATVGSLVGGGDISTGLDSLDHTRDYSMDVTTIVNNWLNGTWTNYGFQILLDNTNTNNGLGIAPAAQPGALELKIEVLSFKVQDVQATPSGDVTIQWASVAGRRYRIESNEDLQGDWDEVATVDGAVGFLSTSYTHVGVMTSPAKTRLFYRIVLLE